MYNSTALLDLHERAHRSVQMLLRHCALLGGDEFDRELPGFGYSTVRLQLEHMIGAEEYWIRVVQGRYTEEYEETACPTLEALKAHRCEVAAATEEYLRQASEQELNTPREMWTWPGKMRLLVPAHVVLRTQTHLYQHQGQVSAMCRLLGRPVPAGMDFPLD